MRRGGFICEPTDETTIVSEKNEKLLNSVSDLGLGNSCMACDFFMSTQTPLESNT